MRCNDYEKEIANNESYCPWCGMKNEVGSSFIDKNSRTIYNYNRNDVYDAILLLVSKIVHFHHILVKN
jgi:hypothetical protein